MTPDVLPRRAGLLRFPTLWLFLHLRTTQYGFGNLFSTYESFDPPSTPAAEVRVIPASHFYFKSMVFATERAPYAHNPTGFVPQFHGDPMSVSEIGYSPGRRASAVRAQDNVEARKGYAGLYRFGGAYNPGMFASTSSNTPGFWELPDLWDSKSGALSYEARHGPWHRRDHRRRLDSSGQESKQSGSYRRVAFERADARPFSPHNWYCLWS